MAVNPRHTIAGSPDRWRRMARPLATIGTLGALTVALHLRDPHAAGSWGICPSALLGFWCPGCGGLRAVNDLTHLRVADALSSNLLFLVVLPIIVFLLARWALDRWRGTQRPTLSRQRTLLLGWIVLPLVVLFMVLRNMPIAPGIWLAP